MIQHDSLTCLAPTGAPYVEQLKTFNATQCNSIIYRSVPTSLDFIVFIIMSIQEDVP